MDSQQLKGYMVNYGSRGSNESVGGGESINFETFFLGGGR